MKTLNLFRLTIIALFFLPTLLFSQEGYTYTLVDNGAYSYTVFAVPNPSTSDFNTSVQGYGFTIIIPDGINLTISSSLGGSGGSTRFEGTDVMVVDSSMADKDGYLVTEELSSPMSIPPPSAETMTAVATLQITSMPTAGEIRILANNSALVTGIPSLESFKTADATDDSMVNFDNVIDNVGSGGTGLSGAQFHSFSTLSTNNLQELTGVSLYPNPTNGMVSIKGANDLQSVEVMNVNGQRVMHLTGNLETINLNTLDNGVYFVTLQNKVARKTIKLVKQ